MRLRCLIGVSVQSSRLHGHGQEIQGINFLAPSARDKMNSARQKYLNNRYEAKEKQRKKKMDIDRVATNSDSYVVPLVTEGGHYNLYARTIEVIGS